MSVVAIVKLRAHQGRGDELLQAVEKPIALTRQNPHCSSVQIEQNTENPDLIVFREEWRSEQDHKRHVVELVEAGHMVTVFPLIGAQIETEHVDQVVAG